MAMAKAKVTVIGLPEALDNLGKIASKARAAGVKAVAEETEEVAEDMRRNAPVGDGRRGRRGRPPLGKSIEASASGLSGEAKVTADHALYVEEGTSRRPARPFAGRAARTAEGRFPKRVTDAVRQAVE